MKRFFQHLLLNRFGRKDYTVLTIPWYVKLFFGKPKYKKGDILFNTKGEEVMIKSDKILLGLTKDEKLNYVYIIKFIYDADLDGLAVLEKNLLLKEA